MEVSKVKKQGIMGEQGTGGVRYIFYNDKASQNNKAHVKIHYKAVRPES